MCWKYDNATGCELASIIGTENVKCAYHTGKLSEGQGIKGYRCYIRARGNLII